MATRGFENVKESDIAHRVKRRKHTLGVPTSSPLAVGSGQTGDILVTHGWSDGHVGEPPKSSKYHNVKTTVDGITFDSAKEAKRYSELRLLEKSGEISDLRCQPEYALHVWTGDHDEEPETIGVYRGDFAYFEGDTQVVEDVKGMKTLPLARWKQKHLAAQYGIIVREIR